MKILTIEEIKALQTKLAEAEALNNKLNAEKIALEPKVKTSKNRDVKAPDTYTILQPLFVTLRGNINKEIVSNDTIAKILSNICSELRITFDLNMQIKIWKLTVLHNSTSNIPDPNKTSTASSAKGKLEAYKEMAIQGMYLLTLITKEQWQAWEAEVLECYNKNPFVAEAEAKAKAEAKAEAEAKDKKKKK